jgi:hypothetical protein
VSERREDEDDSMIMQTIDPDLRRRIVGGEYRVDPHAVAEAMLRKEARLGALRRLSLMLVAGDGQRPSRGADQ